MNNEEQALKNGVLLFCDVYKKNITEKVFYRKHFENPRRLDAPYIIETENEKPVAMRWMMCEKMICNCEAVSAVQSSDDAVLPEARGFRFLKMRKKAINIMMENSVDFEYGCFSKGRAMKIAEKFGEKNVVNLYLARLFMLEKTHRWKRFDIKYPKFFANHLFKKRKKLLENFEDKNLTITVTNYDSFTSEDYAQMNSGNSLQIERNEAYYKWKIADIENICVVIARENEKLQGFLIVQNDGNKKTIVDWDVFGDNKTSVMASLLLRICDNCEFIDIPSLNVESGEMALFTRLGAKDMSKLWAAVCICVKPLNDNIKIDIMNPKLWKHRLLDADYFMNR